MMKVELRDQKKGLLSTMQLGTTSIIYIHSMHTWMEYVLYIIIQYVFRPCVHRVYVKSRARSL